jgi:predicted nucleotidyltransferase
MVYHQVEIPAERIAAFCRNHAVRRLSLFGSILREDFRPDSDIDLLVEFEPGQVPGLLGMAGLEIELSEMLGRRVDLRTAEDLSRYFRDEVLEEAVLQYAG